MAEREDPFIELGPENKQVVPLTSVREFIAWFDKARPVRTVEHQFGWNGYWATYHPETNRISWDGPVLTDPDDPKQVEALMERQKEHRRVRAQMDRKVVFTGPGNGIDLNPVQMVPAIVLPEPKPFYGVDWQSWRYMDPVEKEEAKASYYQSVAALKSLYAAFDKPIAVVK